MPQLQEIIYGPISKDRFEESQRIIVDPGIWGRVKPDYPGADERVWVFTAGKIIDITDMLAGEYPKFALTE